MSTNGSLLKVSRLSKRTAAIKAHRYRILYLAKEMAVYEPSPTLIKRDR